MHQRIVMIVCTFGMKPCDACVPDVLGFRTIIVHIDGKPSDIAGSNVGFAERYVGRNVHAHVDAGGFARVVARSQALWMQFVKRPDIFSSAQRSTLFIERVHDTCAALRNRRDMLHLRRVWSFMRLVRPCLLQLTSSSPILPRKAGAMPLG